MYVGNAVRAHLGTARTGDAMAECFKRSHDAYQSGDGALAKQLSNEGKQHQKEMESLNAEASAWIFRENNTVCGPFEGMVWGLTWFGRILGLER